MSLEMYPCRGCGGLTAQSRRYYDANRDKWQSLPRESKERHRERVAEHRKRNRDMYLAHKAVATAISRGKLDRKPCALCGSGTRVHAHHHNGYSPEHRLDVVWLCFVCHAKEHRKPRIYAATGADKEGKQDV